MKVIRPLMERFFPPHKPIPSGIYHYMAPPEAEFPYRLHLRLEADGRGTLVVNGHTVLHMNQTAAEYAYHLIQNTPTEQVAREVSERYGIKREQAAKDFQDLTTRLKTMVEVPDLEPETYLDFDRQEPYSGALIAPYRLDCALTYALPEAGFAHFTPVDRVKQELPMSDWQTILKKAWDVGIPHAVFTGGEPTMRPDLVDLIKYASDLGMVTGLITNGFRLAERDYLHQVLQSGLDHLMLVLEPVEEQSWEALVDCLAEDLAVTVHLTLTTPDEVQQHMLLDRLAELGVKSVSISASSAELAGGIPKVRQSAADHGLSLVWDLPVPYSKLHPVALELAGGDQPMPQGAGKAWLYVEPDGDVLPGQGELTVLGNLLTDPWEKIWHQPA